MKLWSLYSEKRKFSAFSYLIVQLTSAKLCPLIKDDKRDILLLWSPLSPNMNEVTALHLGHSFLLTKPFSSFNLLINAVILLLNCLVLILHLYIHFLSLRHHFSLLKHYLDLYITDTALKVS